jgi:hypothetical protein
MVLMFPAVLTTLADTQQFLPEFSGSVMLHQLLSELLPVIGEVCPTVRALIGTQAVPGPRRQFTFTSRGKAIGMVGVEVGSGGGVSLGSGVWVGVSVGRGSVAEGVSSSRVGVSVTGTFDGRLQEAVARSSTSTGYKARDFILSPFQCSP